MQAWHPITKLVAVLGVLALAWLWWTGDDFQTGMASDDPAGTVPVAHAEPVAVPEVRPVADGALFARALPSIEAFSGMLERPLFSSTRRPAVVAPELALMDVPSAAVEPAAGFGRPPSGSSAASRKTEPSGRSSATASMCRRSRQATRSKAGAWCRSSRGDCSSASTTSGTS